MGLGAVHVPIKRGPNEIILYHGHTMLVQLHHSTPMSVKISYREQGHLVEGATGAIGIVDLEGPGHRGVTGRMVVIRVVGLPMEDTALREVVVVESGVAEGEARLVEVMEVDHQVEGTEVDHRVEGPGHLEDTALTMVILAAALTVEAMDLRAAQVVGSGVVEEEVHLVVVMEEEAHLVAVMEEEHLLVHPEALGIPNVEG